VSAEDITEAPELGEIRKYRAQLKAAELCCSSTTCSCASSPPTPAFEDWAKLLGDVVVVTPLLDRLMHHDHRLKFEGKSWRIKEAAARVAKRASTV